jgi:hypothetical protein
MAVDFFTVPTATFRVLFVLVVLSLTSCTFMARSTAAREKAMASSPEAIPATRRG